MNTPIDYSSRYSFGHFCCRVKQGKRLSEFLQKYTDSGTKTTNLAGYKNLCGPASTFHRKMRPQASNKQPLLPWQRLLRPLKRAFFCLPPPERVEDFHFPRCLILTETCSWLLCFYRITFFTQQFVKIPGCHYAL